MKKKFLTLLFLFVLSQFPVSGFCNSFAKVDVVTKNAFLDIEILKHILETRYAPFDWKQEFFGWNVEKEVQIAKLKILKFGYPSTKQCQKIIAEFMSSLRDYHVGSIFYSTEEARLPFVLKKSSSGRLFVTHIFPECPVSLEVGDEIISINHKTSDVIINNLKKNNASSTDISLGISKLTTKLGSLGDEMPLGLVVMEVQKIDNTRIVFQCPWKISPELILDFSKVQRKNQKKKLDVNGAIFNQEKDFVSEKCFYKPYLSWLKVNMLPVFWSEMKTDVKHRSHSHLIGNKRGFIPKLGKNIIWTADSDFDFYSYICEMTMPSGENKKIGFLRIPSYMYDINENSFLLPWDQLVSIISILNSETDLLVIDQQDNPGGSVFFMYGIVSMLIDNSVKLPFYRLVLNQEDLDMAVHLKELLEPITTNEEAEEILGESLEGLVVDKDLADGLSSFCSELIKTWESGEYELTHPMPFFGFKEIKPHPYCQYDKPIILLVNENSFSCADFLPAIFKDNKRALLFGMPTSGAGGFVYNCSFPNLTGIKSCSFTGSLSIRENLQVIENVGISPDIRVELSDTDLRFGCYTDFMASLKECIFNLIENN